jgi:hypothetical protein
LTRRGRRPASRLAASLLVATIAWPAAAYLPPATAILKRVVQRREEQKVTALEVHGRIAFSGPAADRVRALAGIVSASGDVTIPATLLVKAPSRCRLELAQEGTPSALRPALSTRGGHLSGRRGFDSVPAARALVDGVCALLAERGIGTEPERAIARRLADHGVDLREVSLGRLQGRVAWVIGGRPQDAQPQAWIDKQTFQPIRLVSMQGGATRDVRLLPGPAAAARFPMAVEVWSGGQLEARFSTEAVTANPRLPDALFP